MWARELRAACEQAGVDWAAVAQGQIVAASAAAAETAQHPDELGAAASNDFDLTANDGSGAAAAPRAASGSRARSRSRSRSSSPGQGRWQRGGGSDGRGSREHAGRVASRLRGPKHGHGKRKGGNNNGGKSNGMAHAPGVLGTKHSCAPTRSESGIAAVTCRHAQGCSWCCRGAALHSSRHRWATRSLFHSVQHSLGGAVDVQPAEYAAPCACMQDSYTLNIDSSLFDAS